MPVFVSAKGADFSAWRPAGDYVVTFRQALLDSIASSHAAAGEERLQATGAALEELAAANDRMLAEAARILDQMGQSSATAPLAGLTRAYFDVLYDQFELFRSPQAFFQQSHALLVQLAGTLTRLAADRIGIMSRTLPDVELVVLGPAGRLEFSPFCPLQLVLVHGPASSADIEVLSLFSHFIHEGFLGCGFLADSRISPRNPLWRGAPVEWELRITQGLEHGEREELIDLLRLADQAELTRNGGESGFGARCLHLLAESRPTLAFLVTRLMGLSNGIGLMGGLRLIKTGSERGLFALLDHALLPLSATVTSLALIRGVTTVGTTARIRELLARGELNVDMAERLLQAWQALHELRLDHERSLLPDWGDRLALYLDPEKLSNNERDRLREALETVGTAQRQTGVIFSGLGE